MQIHVFLVHHCCAFSQSPIEHVQAETAQHSEELSRLKALIKDLAKKQDIMDQKQDLILQYLKPKQPTTDDTASVSNYDVTTKPAVTSGSEKSSTVGGEYKLKSSGSKKSTLTSSSDTGEEDDDKEDDHDDE